MVLQNKADLLREIQDLYIKRFEDNVEHREILKYIANNLGQSGSESSTSNQIRFNGPFWVHGTPTNPISTDLELSNLDAVPGTTSIIYHKSDTTPIINLNGFKIGIQDGDYLAQTPAVLHAIIISYTIGDFVEITYRRADADGNIIHENIQVNKSIYSNQEFDNGSSGSSKIIDWKAKNYQKITLTNDCTFTFANPLGVTTLQLKIIQDNTGGHAVTWPSNLYAEDGAAPELTADVNAIDIITLYFDGTNYFVTALKNLQDVS